jgi:cysteine desulfurase/selenocysteine lyase
MKIDNKTALKLKKDFPIFRNNKGLVYLDSAATSQKPDVVIDSVKDFYEKENANVGRGVYTLAVKATERFEEARRTVARFINASPSEIVFTKNTTESINLLSYVLHEIIPNRKDEIVVTEMEHHSNLIPWQQMAKRHKMKLKVIKVKDDFTLDMEDARQKITKATALVAVAHVSNVLGTVNPIEEICRIANTVGAYTIIDAAQSVPSLRVDVKKINCDFLAFSSHKMLGPAGVGVLYGRRDLIERLSPFMFGGGMIKKVSLGSAEFANIPERFEAGTQNYPGVLALAEAIRYMEKIGIENITAWEKTLTSYALEKLAGVPGIKIYNPGTDNSAGIISFSLKGIHPHDVAELLNAEGVAVRAGHNCAMPLMSRLGVQGVTRASFHIYNTFEDIDKLVSGLKKVSARFGK